MLAAMVETWVLWLFVVGVTVGAVVALVVAVRLPRQEDDVSDLERPAEAAWISSVIERHGGIAPESLVEEILDLHQAYLRDPRLSRPPIEQADLPASPELMGGPSITAPGYPPGYAPDRAPDQEPSPPGRPVGAITPRPPR